MPASGHQLRSFLRAVHRRLIVARFAESIGGGVVAGSIAALPLVAIQLWRDEPALPAAVLLMLVGAAGGLFFALRAWPGQLEAAHQVDEQLQLTDLLSTAVVMQKMQQDPWARSVLAMAESRCRTLSPSDVILHRWGIRTWGGMGLTAAIVLAVSLLGSGPNPLEGTENEASIAANRIPQRLESPDPFIPPAPEVSLQKADPTVAPSEGKQADQSHQNAAEASAQNRRSDIPQGGGGTGATESSVVPPRLRSTAASELGITGVVPAAGGSTSVDAERGPEAVSGGDGANVSFSGVAPWQSESWATDRDRAIQAIGDGAIPDSYRDLIRDYFTPSDP